MSKISQMMIYKIYITHLKVELECFKNDNSKIPSGSCSINIKNSNIKGLTILLDERFNTLSFPKKILNDEESHIITYLLNTFNELKSSKFQYGTIGDDDYEYEPTENIYVEDFFNYLKIEKRENILENILK